LKDSQIDQIKELNQATVSFLNQEMTQEQYQTVLTDTRMIEQGSNPKRTELKHC
jgi:hypothetical protein